MARARNIKPALFRNEVLGVADPLYTLLFQSLWLLADREGRLEDRPIRIKADTFPYREGLNVDAMLAWLHENGFIIRYSFRENRYIQVCNFTKHQNPHKNEASSEIPSFSNGCTTSEKIGTTSEKIGSAPADSLNLITDSGFLKPESISPPPAASPVGDDVPDDRKSSRSVTARMLVSDHGVPQQVAEDFIAIRKAKRAPLTATAIAGIQREVGIAGITLEDALRMCVERGWQGFKAEWATASARPGAPAKKNSHDLSGKNWHEGSENW